MGQVFFSYSWHCLSSLRLHYAHHMLHVTLMLRISATSWSVSATGSKIVAYQVVAKLRQTYFSGL